MQPMNRQMRRRYFYLFLALFVLFIPAILLYTSGYRIKDFQIVETGGVYIYAPESYSQIYINNELYGETSILDKDLFVQNLTPGNYQILITREGFWPWAKEIEVRERRVAEAVAFLVPQEIEQTVIEPLSVLTPEESGTGATTTQPNTLYTKLDTLFIQKYKESLPTEKQKTAIIHDIRIALDSISHRGHVGLWSTKRQLYAVWLDDEERIANYFCNNGACSPIVPIFKPEQELKSFAFYPGREDVVILTAGESILAVEIDQRNPQNVQTIYKGNDPDFLFHEGSFFVQDNDTIISLEI